MYIGVFALCIAFYDILLLELCKTLFQYDYLKSVLENLCEDYLMYIIKIAILSCYFKGLQFVLICTFLIAFCNYN